MTRKSCHLMNIFAEAPDPRNNSRPNSSHLTNATPTVGLYRRGFHWQ